MLAALFLILLVTPGAAEAQAERAPVTAWAQDALARALATSADIADPFHHAQVLAEIAEAQAAADDAAGALTTLGHATSIAQLISEEALKSWALHDIGLAYVKADDLEAAEARAASIHDVRLHDTVLVAVQNARRGVRDVQGATATAMRITDLVRQGQSLRAIANQQASQSDFTSAMATVHRIQNAAVNAFAVSDVAAAIAREGSVDEARELVMHIRDSQSRSRGLAEVAAAQASSGDVKGALTTAAAVDDKLERAEALARIASVRETAAPAEARELFAQSLALVERARGGAVRRCVAFIEIGRAQLAAGEKDAFAGTLKRAFDELSTIKNGSDRVNLLSQIAPLQARAGDFTGAFSTAMRAEDQSLRPLLVRDIATSQAEKGDIEGAVAIARTLDDRPAAAAALFGVLRVQSQAHDIAGMHETIRVTLQAVRFIGNAELRAGALGSLAAAHVLEGDAEGAQALFSEAMTTAAAVDGGPQRAAVYARIADSLADRHRPFVD